MRINKGHIIHHHSRKRFDDDSADEQLSSIPSYAGSDRRNKRAAKKDDSKSPSIDSDMIVALDHQMNKREVQRHSHPLPPMKAIAVGEAKSPVEGGKVPALNFNMLDNPDENVFEEGQGDEHSSGVKDGEEEISDDETNSEMAQIIQEMAEDNKKQS